MLSNTDALGLVYRKLAAFIHGPTCVNINRICQSICKQYFCFEASQMEKWGVPLGTPFIGVMLYIKVIL